MFVGNVPADQFNPASVETAAAVESIVFPDTATNIPLPCVIAVHSSALGKFPPAVHVVPFDERFVVVLLSAMRANVPLPYAIALQSLVNVRTFDWNVNVSPSAEVWISLDPVSGITHTPLPYAIHLKSSELAMMLPSLHDSPSEENAIAALPPLPSPATATYFPPPNPKALQSLLEELV